MDCSQFDDHWQAMVEELAAEGQRVIAVATRMVKRDQVILNSANLAGQLTLIGLIGLIDPPRAEAVEAVAECHAAGIRVKMITGDHAATARAIAAQIGLDDPRAEEEIPKVLSGRELEAMSDAELIQAATATAVFARVTPEQKLRLVEALQAHGEVAAMTGARVLENR